jgi:hypothetical protein
MRIRHLSVRNFRGIRQLDWSLPDRHVLCLIGRGDSTKSTILEALRRVFHPQWNLAFDDADFYQCVATNTIKIDVILGEIPDNFRDLGSYGHWLCGWNQTTPLPPSRNSGRGSSMSRPGRALSQRAVYFGRRGRSTNPTCGSASLLRGRGRSRRGPRGCARRDIPPHREAAEIAPGSCRVRDTALRGLHTQIASNGNTLAPSASACVREFSPPNFFCRIPAAHRKRCDAVDGSSFPVYSDRHTPPRFSARRADF